MNLDKLPQLHEINNALEHTSVADGVVTLLLLIPIFVLAGLPLVWALKKGYLEALKRFEEANPHLKGQYFSFWRWVYLKNDNALIGTKHYKAKFAEQPFTNTDTISQNIRQFADSSKGIGKKFSVITKAIIVGFVTLMVIAIAFH